MIFLQEILLSWLQCADRVFTYFWRLLFKYGRESSVQLLVNWKDANAFRQHQTCKVRDSVDEYFTIFSPTDAHITHFCHYDFASLPYVSRVDIPLDKELWT